jgi:hypothetical protein
MLTQFPQLCLAQSLLRLTAKDSGRFAPRSVVRSVMQIESEFQTPLAKLPRSTREVDRGSQRGIELTADGFAIKKVRANGIPNRLVIQVQSSGQHGRERVAGHRQADENVGQCLGGNGAFVILKLESVTNEVVKLLLEVTAVQFRVELAHRVDPR